MTDQNHHDLQPMEPERARELYLDHKQTQCSEVTVQSHRYRLNHFVRWCEENTIENLNNLTGRDLHEFRLWRKKDGDLNTVTMQTQMSTLRVFIKWCRSIEAVDPDLYTKILIPQVSDAKDNRDVMLEADHADELTRYLSQYHYASRDHVLFAVLWETGMRIGAVRSLDLNDVYIEERCFELEHRPEKGTTLKNGQNGERLVAISADLAELVEDFIENTRAERSDDYGRHPLVTGNQGRCSRSTIRRNVYALTAPCFLDNECPNCNGTVESKCPEAVSPHAIRRGSITHLLTNDVPVEIVGDRTDVSRDVIDKHYDQRSEEVKLEQRRGYLDDI
ncbi:MAG: site-specific recombinase XerD [uncultured archaeon A07HR60]|nr:MAG: site-specific recombinase XerD [uncultured archaeon A07HR60]